MGDIVTLTLNPALDICASIERVLPAHNGRDIAFRASAPIVHPVSTVGGGDSFLGALVLALSRGQSLRDALAFATAAGSAALLSRGTDLCHVGDVERLRANVRIDEL